MADRQDPYADMIVAEIAAELGVSHRRAHKLISTGRISNARRLGRWWVAPRSDVEAFKKTRPQKTVT